MTLEILTHGRPDLPPRPPILLVHGAWHGAWCWQENFLGWFASRGFETRAVSLRGHGKSEGRDRLRWHRIDDYVDDIAQAAQGLAVPPVVIGHSMGGYAVQRFLARHPARAGVLLASVPVAGAWPVTARILKRDAGALLKVLATLSLYPLMEDPRRASRLLFSDRLGHDALMRHHSQLQDESIAALFDMIRSNRQSVRQTTVPVAVLGGGRDVLCTPNVVRATARAYGTDAKLFPDLGHNLMNDPDWPQVAGWIECWISGLESRAGG